MRMDFQRFFKNRCQRDGIVLSWDCLMSFAGKVMKIYGDTFGGPWGATYMFLSLGALANFF